MSTQSRIYTTWDEAVACEVVKPIEAGGAASADGFNIKAIANTVLDYDDAGQGFVVREEYRAQDTGATRFWDLVSEQAFELFDAEFSEREPYKLAPTDGGDTDYGQAQDFEDISILVPESEDEDLAHINGRALSTQVPIPVSQEWEPGVYDKALRQAGWVRVGAYNGPNGMFQVRVATADDD